MRMIEAATQPFYTPTAHSLFAGEVVSTRHYATAQRPTHQLADSLVVDTAAWPSIGSAGSLTPPAVNESKFLGAADRGQEPLVTETPNARKSPRRPNRLLTSLAVIAIAPTALLGAAADVAQAKRYGNRDLTPQEGIALLRAAKDCHSHNAHVGAWICSPQPKGGIDKPCADNNENKNPCVGRSTGTGVLSSVIVLYEQTNTAFIGDTRRCRITMTFKGGHATQTEPVCLSPIPN